MTKYNITGMSCAACSAKVEKAVSKLDNVDSVSVNLLTGEMMVEGTADSGTVISAVVNAGYGAVLGEKADRVQQGAADDDKEYKDMVKRLLLSLFFLVPLMYVTMGYMMLGWPLPFGLSESNIAIALAELYFTGAIIVINRRFFVNGVKGVLRRSPNMDTLVAIGAGTAFLYSSYSLFKMAYAAERGDLYQIETRIHDLYFESAAMILTLITVGKTLETRAKGKTTDAISKLLTLSPKTVIILKDGAEKEVDAATVKPGDTFVVKSGGIIPVDGIILSGNASMDESSITGESINTDKEAGDAVISGTTNCSGYIVCEAVKTGEDTTISQIINMVREAAGSKAPIARIADRVSGFFVPVVMIIAVVTTVVWLLSGESTGFALARGISVLVISCPCALGLATPVAIMVGNGVGAQNGILFKNAAALEMAGRIRTVLLDKTGTLTEGRPEVVNVYSEIEEQEFLRLAYSLERLSEHPLARAVVRYAGEKGVDYKDAVNFENIAGSGISAQIEDGFFCAGKYEFVSGFTAIPEKIRHKADKLADSGRTVVFFAGNGKFLGYIAVADRIRKDSAFAVKGLRNMGIRVVMVTGDNKKTANRIAKEAACYDVVAEVLPNEKARVVEKYAKDGRVAMVGDGINDAPALSKADLGIAIGSGTDIAMDSADVVLVKNSLCDVVTAIKLGRKVLLNIKENLFWAFIYNFVGIPVAAGVFIKNFGISMSPMFGALAMSMSSFCVVMNALRLNFTKKYKYVKMEESNMSEKTIFIKGMMCGHCEAHVKKALEALDGVAGAMVSYEKGIAVVSLSGEVDNAILTKAVEEQDYTVERIE